MNKKKDREMEEKELTHIKDVLLWFEKKNFFPCNVFTRCRKFTHA